MFTSDVQDNVNVPEEMMKHEMSDQFILYFFFIANKAYLVISVNLIAWRSSCPALHLLFAGSVNGLLIHI